MSEEHRPIQFLWAIDKDAPGGMVPLPASPLLLPAMLAVGAFMAVISAIGIVGRGLSSPVKEPKGVPRHVYERYKKRYLELIDKKLSEEGLSVQETYELNAVIKLPPWSPNVPWHY